MLFRAPVVPSVALAALVAPLLAAPAALAHEGDIGLVFQNNRLTTGIVEDLPGGGEVVLPGQRVFAAEFGLLAGDVYADEPGLFASPLAPLPASTPLAFTILSAVRSWDFANGTFNGPASASPITLEFLAGALSATTPAADAVVPGFAFSTGATGAFDEHYDFFLEAPAGAAAPAPGIYLLELSLSLAGLPGSESAPVYLVFNFGADEAEHDAAVEWTEANRVVPSPGAAALLALAGLALRRRRAPAA